jgi:uncharacterized protein YeaO (DUF488 family)
MKIHLKRIYDKPEAEDGLRVLVERLWPRGLSKKDAKVDQWVKDAAPSTELRKWFGHDASKWKEFRKRYYEELDNKPDVVEKLLEILKRDEQVTFVFASREKKYNNSAALKEYLESRPDNQAA